MSADRPRTVVVTGASAGLGYFASEQLAAAGHRVVLATRNPTKAAAAEQSIVAHVPGAQLEHLHIDLGDLDSVHAAADALADLGPIDAVLNNAGVVGSAERRTTAQGIELQFGTNHIGHFAWTARVLPLLEATGGRVVHLGSIIHRWAWLDLAHPEQTHPYVNYLQYARSKLAVMRFGFELAERLADAGSAVSSVVAHPGFALDTLAPARPGVLSTTPTPGWVRAGERFWAQGKDIGAGPLVHAAVGTGVRSGEYWGPDGWMQLRGAPAVVPAKPHAHDRNAAAHLWTASERLSGVSFGLPGRS